MQTIKDKMNTIKNTCQKVNSLVTILLVISILFILGYAIYTMFVIFIPKENFTAVIGSSGTLNIMNAKSNFAFGSSIGYGYYPQAIEIVDYSVKSLQIFNLILTIVLMLIPFSIILLCIRGILESVYSNSTPFIAENCKRLRIIAIIIILNALLFKIVYVLLAAVFVFNFQHFSCVLDIDFFNLLLGALLFVLAHIFEYGSLLQVEYDETI